MTVPTLAAAFDFTWTGSAAEVWTGFRAQAVEHLVVTDRSYVTPVTLTRGVHYTARIDAGSGTAWVAIIPGAMPAQPRAIRVLRVTPSTQVATFANYAPFDAAALETLFDDNALRDQELDRGATEALGRLDALEPRADALEDRADAIEREAVRGQPGEVMQRLPAAAARAGQAFVFDGAGQPATGSRPIAPYDLTTIANHARTLIAGDVAALTLPAATMTLEIIGYHAAFDGGGGVWRRLAGPEAGALRSLDRFTAAGAIDATNGGYWGLLADPIDIRQLGGHAGLADIAPVINAALTRAAAIAASAVVVPNVTYTQTTLIYMVSGVELRGAGPLSKIVATTIPYLAGTVAAPYAQGNAQVLAFNVDDWAIRNIGFDNKDDPFLEGGTRCIAAIECSFFQVTGCRFWTLGAATACLASTDYLISRNKAWSYRYAPTGDSLHDGMYDQWWGCARFEVSDNYANGNGDGYGVGRFGVMVTGTTSFDNIAAACTDFKILRNRITNMKEGMWINGRTGVNSDFEIVGNVIDNCTQYRGIDVSDSTRFKVSGNRIRAAKYNGILIYNETGWGTAGCSDFEVSNNEILDCNTSLNTGFNGIGILIRDNAVNGIVSDNLVRGANHTYPVGIQHATSSAVSISGRGHRAGTSGRVFNLSTGNLSFLQNDIDGVALYTPSIASVANVGSATASRCNALRLGDWVHVTGQVVVTPSVANVQTKLGIALPYASALTDARQLYGSATDGFGNTAVLTGDITNDRAELQFQINGTAAYIWRFSFVYQLL